MEVDIEKQNSYVQKSINQIVDILDLLEDNNKIPKNVKAFFRNHYDHEIEYNRIISNIPIESQIMEEYTVEILTYIVKKYLKKIDITQETMI